MLIHPYYELYYWKYYFYRQYWSLYVCQQMVIHFQVAHLFNFNLVSISKIDSKMHLDVKIIMKQFQLIHLLI